MDVLKVEGEELIFYDKILKLNTLVSLDIVIYFPL